MSDPGRPLSWALRRALTAEDLAEIREAVEAPIPMGLETAASTIRLLLAELTSRDQRIKELTELLVAARSFHGHDKEVLLAELGFRDQRIKELTDAARAVVEYGDDQAIDALRALLVEESK